MLIWSCDIFLSLRVFVDCTPREMRQEWIKTISVTLLWCALYSSEDVPKRREQMIVRKAKVLAIRRVRQDFAAPIFQIVFSQFQFEELLSVVFPINVLRSSFNLSKWLESWMFGFGVDLVGRPGFTYDFLCLGLS